VFGSSLSVQPAARLPLIAQHSGAKLVIVNREITPLDIYADLIIHEDIGNFIELLI
jgi:NAD-dependent deacetylase